MTRRAAGHLLLVAGGMLIVLGSFAPEIRVLVANRLSSGAPLPSPDRSHWVVFNESVDMLRDPDLSLGWSFYLYCAAEAAALGYLALVGLALAASSLFERSRWAAAIFFAFHGISLAAIAAVGIAISLEPSEEGEGSGGLARTLLLGSLLLLAVLVGEAFLARWGLRAGRRSGLLAVDLANLLPAALLAVLGVALTIALCGHPNWPAGGYPPIACGAVLAIAGMVLRREVGGQTVLSSSCPAGS